MNNKVIAKLCAILIVICVALTTVATVFAVEDGAEGTPTTSSAVSQEASSVVQSSESDANGTSSETPATSAPTESQNSAPVQSSVSSVEVSTVTSSGPVAIVSSEAVQSIASTLESSESAEPEESFEDSSSKKTSSKTTSSNKTSSKKNSSKSNSLKKNDGEVVSSYIENTVSYQAPSYNDGSLSEDWENNDEVVVSTKEETKELSDHMFDPKKAVVAWIWLPILVALACIGVLIYVNVYVYNRGVHSGSGVKNAVSEEDDDVYEEADEEQLQIGEEETEEDPFSAVNFFKFEDEED